MRRALLTILVALAPTRALAFESECVRDVGMSHTPLQMEASICRIQYDGNDERNCGDGVNFARGAQMGEHSFLTYQGMRWAGIPEALLTDTQVLRYFATGEGISGSGNVASIAPAAPSRMHVAVNQPIGASIPRPITIAEFGQALDGSYSLADFLSGNEHCPISTQTTGSFAEMQACHEFRSHVQVTNSTHFQPQTREMSRRYHKMAMQTADNCLAMSDAFQQQTGGDAAHPLAARNDTIVRQCIKEALAIEAIAAHFLEDGWSTGHMWQRWGTPIFPLDQDYVANHIVGIVSGVIHGWRSVARDVTATRLAQHDQMCMPGPRFANDLIGSWQRKEKDVDWTVLFSYAPGAQIGNLSRDPIPGGGDCYVLPCSMPGYDPETNKSPRWALYYEGNSNQTTPLYTQRARMMTCLRRGFEEVYERLPQGPYGALTPLVAEQYVDQAVGKADRASQGKTAGMQSDVCWQQRVTNQAMSLSGKMGALPMNLFNPISGGHLNIEFAEWRAGKISFDDQRRQNALKPQRDAVEKRLRKELIDMGAYVYLRADEDPDGTDLAELTDPIMASLVGVRRNGDAADLVKMDKVPYLEHPDRFYWHNDVLGTCNKDQDCRDVDDHSYCDPGAAVDRTGPTPQSMPGCVTHDMAVARAFREAETIYWCGVQDLDDVRGARDGCKGRPPGSPECVACVGVVLPRLRNGCEPSLDGFIPLPAGGGDNRATCDLLVDATSAGGGPRITPTLYTSPRVYWPHVQQPGESAQAARERAALEACQAGDDGYDGRTRIDSYGYVPTPPLVGTPFPISSRSIYAGTCGMSPTPTHWYRLTGTEVRDYRVRLYPTGSMTLGYQGIEHMSLDLYAGPACDASTAPLASGAAMDMDADGVPDWFELVASVPSLPYEVCLRVQAKDPLARTTWALYIDRL